MTKPAPPLLIDWATKEAAEFACRHWHYSGVLPGTGNHDVRVGVWEQGRFVGAVLFSMGANNHIGWPYGLAQDEVCELTRVALTKHQTPVSRVLKFAVQFLQRKCPGLKLVVSYADTAQNHHGGIYQACGWVYVGAIESNGLVIHGKRVHPRTSCARYGKGGNSIEWLRKHVDPNAERFPNPPKHKYLLPLHRSVKEQVQALGLPYPKRAAPVMLQEVCA